MDGGKNEMTTTMFVRYSGGTKRRMKYLPSTRVGLPCRAGTRLGESCSDYSCLATYSKLEQVHKNGETLDFGVGRHSKLCELDPAVRIAKNLVLGL